MSLLMAAFAASLVATLLLVRAAKGGRRAFDDSELAGPQKFHVRPVPRVGGIAIVFGSLAGAFVLVLRDAAAGIMALSLLGCALPVFVAGLAEDITKRISPRRRLFFTVVSAGLAAWVLQALITYTAIPGLDWVVGFPLGAALVTLFVVTGVANSINIIDGFNGLASMCSLLILASLAYVGHLVGDPVVIWTAVACAGAVAGFFVWNYPAGLIFLGDGGAYFLGFMISEVAILLLHRNPRVSPMFPLLLCIYPVFETLFSMYRRRFLQAVPSHMPDGIHLHSLIYRRLMRWAVGERDAKALTRRNSMTSPYLWMLCMVGVVPALLFWDDTAVLAGFIGVFGVAYLSLYWRIVRFRSPRWMVLRRRARPGTPVAKG